MPEFFALLNALPNPALILDAKKGVVQICNAAFQKLSAFSQGELIGSNLSDLIPGIDLLRLSQGEETLTPMNRRSRPPLDVLVTASALDAQTQWLLVNVIAAGQAQTTGAQRDQMGKRMAALAALSDATDLQSALEKAVEICKTLFSTDHVAIYQVDPSAPHLRRVVCCGTDGSFPETMPSGDLIRLSETCVWSPGRRVQTELHRFARIGGLSYLASTPLGLGRALMGLLVVGDTTAEPSPYLPEFLEGSAMAIGTAIQHFLLTDNMAHEMEQQGRRNSIYAAIFENTEEGVMVLEPGLNVREINSAAEWILGYANWEAQGQPVENILIGAGPLIPALEAACQGIPTHNIGNVHLHRRNGQSFPAHLQAVPVQKGGELLAVIVFLTDMSMHEQIRLRTQQLEHRALLGDVTAVFAHEVRNPINNISTGLQLMAMRFGPDDPNLELLNRMEGDCTRLNHLMESVLAFSRPIEPKFEPVDITLLVRRLLDRWHPRMTRVNVQPFLQSAENTPKIMADPRSLEQVFTNLVSNAVEAMSTTGGTLAVKIAPSDTLTTPPHVDIIVSDTGPGIPDDMQAHVFEPFVSNKSSGTGLGLAITKRIVTAHHGSIGVDSFPGGTVFRVQLPAVQGE